MSELKAFNSERIYWAVEQVERVDGDIDSIHLDDNLFYIKSEADKVIADKDKELRHHKYKRCLAMARWCKRNRLHASVCGPIEKIDFWNKWQKRWLELAERFK